MSVRWIDDLPVWFHKLGLHGERCWIVSIFLFNFDDFFVFVVITVVIESENRFIC